MKKIIYKPKTTRGKSGKLDIDERYMEVPFVTYPLTANNEPDHIVADRGFYPIQGHLWDESRYAWYVDTDIMEPEIKRGDVLLVEWNFDREFFQASGRICFVSTGNKLFFGRFKETKNTDVLGQAVLEYSNGKVTKKILSPKEKYWPVGVVIGLLYRNLY